MTSVLSAPYSSPIESCGGRGFTRGKGVGMKKLQPAKCIALSMVAMAIGMLCVAGCSPQASDGQADSSTQGAGAAQQTQSTAWSLDMECGTCHSIENATMEDGVSGASVHVQQAQTTCATCHVDEQALAAAHEGKTASDTMPKKLKKTEVSADACTASGCHAETADERVQLTAGYTELTDTQGTQVNPHEVMGLTEGHADITCADCHNMHGKEAAAADLCVSCHHAGVYECNTCH